MIVLCVLPAIVAIHYLLIFEVRLGANLNSTIRILYYKHLITYVHFLLINLFAQWISKVQVKNFENS